MNKRTKIGIVFKTVFLCIKFLLHLLMSYYKPIMKYIVCQKPGLFELKEKEVPRISEGQVLIQIKAIGICGTDLHAYAGNQAYFEYPRILGHELGAEVVLSSGKKVTKFKPGDRVVVMPYISCGNCIACISGKTNCCTDIQVLGVHTDGGMQEQITVPENILLKVNGLSYSQMAIVEPLAIGAHAIRRASIQKEEFVVVVGCGPIGLGIQKLAQLQGAKVIALDVVNNRLEYAQSIFGADFIVNASESPVEEIAKITNGNMATAVFDASGNKTALEKGPDFMAHGGRYILVGLSKGDLQFNHPAIHAKETTLLCSRNAVLEDFEWIIKILKDGAFPSDSFITHTVEFNEMIEQFDNWLDPKSGTIKAIVRI